MIQLLTSNVIVHFYHSDRQAGGPSSIGLKWSEMVMPETYVGCAVAPFVYLDFIFRISQCTKRHLIDITNNLCMYVYTYICTHTAFIYTLCNYDFITPSLNCSHFFFHQIILHIFNRFFFLCYRYLRLYFAIVANVTSCWDSRYVHFKWDFATCHTKCCKWKRTNVAIRQSRSAHRNTYNETHTHTHSLGHTHIHSLIQPLTRYEWKLNY